MSQSERRQNRSANTTRALCFQLDACLKEAELDGMLLADDDGVCLAAAGDDGMCDEIAAHLPMMGRKVDDFAGVLLGADHSYDIEMRGFEVHGSQLYICAIGEGAKRSSELQRGIQGASRILLPQAA